ncbi:MAG: lipopolysaccharide biosynthesis protein [Cohnella sp.]|nr:lipopolysaccharide biosynthesis protein [Cohnella sp.]
MELELKDYFRIIRKRWILLLGIVLLAGAASGIYSYMFIEKVYQASTKLIVNKSDAKVMSNDQLNLNDINLNIRLIDTYKEIIKTPAIMDIVASQFPQFNLTAEQLIDKVRVSSVNNTQVMTVIVQDKSYERAADIVNAISTVFQAEISKIYKVDNVSILNQAKMLEHPSPVKPNPKLNIAIAMIVALMIAVGIVFLLEYLDDSIKTDADVEKYLGVPTLAMITRVSHDELVAKQEQQSSKRQVGETTNATIR